MNISNAKFLEDHRDAYDEIINAQTATKALAIRTDLHRILKEEFIPGYIYTDTCGDCLFVMTKMLYSRFDAWKLSQKQIVISTSFPVNDPPELVEVDDKPEVIPTKPIKKHDKR